MAKKGKAREAQPLALGRTASAERLQEIKTSLNAFNDSFSTLLGMVPAKFYLHNDDGEEEDLTASSGKKLSKKAARKQAALNQEEILRAKKLAKKAKYDPSVPRTVLEIQAARAAAAEDDEDEGIDFDMSGGGLGNSGNAAQGTSSRVLNANGKRTAQDDDDVEDGEDSPNESDFEDDVEDENLTVGNAAASKKPVSSANNASISDIRARLQARIAEKASNRTPAPVSTASVDGDGEGAGEANRDALLQERRKRAGEVRDKRRAAVQERKRKEKEQGIVGDKKKARDEMLAGSGLQLSSQMAKKSSMSDLKKQLKKEGKRQAPVNTDDDGPSLTAVARTAPQPASSSASKAAVAQSAPAPAPMASQSSNADTSATIAFSSLDFTPSTATPGPDAQKLSKKQRLALGNSTRTGITSNDPSVALNSLNKRKEFLDKLTPQARERAEEKDKWERMALKAAGTKVFDEEGKLKKMVKRKEKAKDKSRKDWADRKETVVNAEAAKQKKRTENINARLQQRKDKKMGVKPGKSLGKGNAKKKGRPGFEGKGGAKRK